MCRVAKVKVGDTVFTRSIAHLYPLEIEDGEEHCVQSSETDNPDDEEHLQLPEFQLQPARADVTGETHTKDTTGPPVEKESIQVLDEDENADDISPDVCQSIRRDSAESVVPKSYSLTEPMSNESEGSGSIEQSLESRPRRVAATRALEKIREWTSSLVTLLSPFVGSVATIAKP
jgi:hypothetical protein